MTETAGPDRVRSAEQIGLSAREAAASPAPDAAGTKTMLTNAAPSTTWRRARVFRLVRQPLDGGWAYWMLSDVKQCSMLRTSGRARPLTAATAAPATTESATPTADLARDATITAHTTATSNSQFTRGR